MASSVTNPLRAVLGDLVTWLANTEVRGLVIGGVAASLLGRPRATRDIDVLILLDEERWEDFLTVGSRFGFTPRRADAIAFAHKLRVLLVRHIETGIDVDIICGALPFEEEAVARGVRIDVDGVMIPLPTPEDLMVMKAVARRPRDLVDVEALLDAHPTLDLGHVRRWVREFATALEEPEILGDLENLIKRRRPG